MKKFLDRLNLKKTWWSLLGQLLVEIFVLITDKEYSFVKDFIKQNG